MVNPTGYTALDLVGYTDRGTYAAATNYVKNDLAHHNGIIWRCLIDDTIGITPVEGANWTVFINAGSAAAEEIIAPIETSPAEAAHTSGTQLIYNDTLYDVIANISIGDSLTVGTNIQAAPKISSQIQTLSTQVDENATDIQTLSNEVAHVNTSNTTADKAYAKGEQFSLGGLLCKALTDIASGATLTLNSNYAQVSPLAQQISQAPIEVTAAMCNSKATPASGISYYSKVGRLCNLNAVLTVTEAIGGGSSIITSPPTGMKPIGMINFLMRYGGDWHLAQINAGGQVASNDSIPAGSTVVINVTYVSYN